MSFPVLLSTCPGMGLLDHVTIHGLLDLRNCLGAVQTGCTNVHATPSARPEGPCPTCFPFPLQPSVWVWSGISGDYLLLLGLESEWAITGETKGDLSNPGAI